MRLSTRGFCFALAVAMATASTSADELWTPIGPDGGTVHRFAVDPSNPARVLALSASQRWPLFKSTNGGRSWSPSGLGLTPGRVIAIAPSDPSRVYVGTGAGQVYRSKNGGATFLPVGDPLPGLDPYDLYSIAVDPGDADLILVGTYGNHGLFRSTDGGETWSLPTTAQLPWTISNIVADTAAAATFYAAGASTVFLSRSTDGGVSWQDAGASIKVPDAAFTVGTWDVIAAGVSLLALGKGIPSKDDVLRSTDAGATWTPSQDGLETLTHGIRLQGDPEAGDLFLLDLFNTLYSSPDGGETWSSTILPETMWSLDLVLTDQGFGSLEPLIGGIFSGPTYRRGSGWRFGTGFGLAHASLGVTPVAPDRVYAVTFVRTLRSDDRGSTWSELSVAPGEKIFPSAVAVDATDSASAIMRSSSRGLHATTDAGESWTELAPGLSETDWIQQLQATRLAGTFLLASTEAFRRTTDGGLTWTDVVGLPAAADRRIYTDAAGLTTYCLLGPSGGPASLYRSSDGGANWTTTGADVTALSLSALAPSPRSPLVAYLASGAGDVLRTTDGGSTWAPTGASLPGSVADLHVDYSGWLWARVGLPSEPSSTWSSRDGGASWHEEDLGAETAAFEIRSTPGAVYLADGSGVLRRDFPVAFFSDGFESGDTEEWTSPSS